MQVSFEFKNRKATPVIRGIVIASEHETLILEVRKSPSHSSHSSLIRIGVSFEQAYWQAEHHRAEKEEIKRQADVLKRWTRLVKGLQIRRRLQAQYQRTDMGADLPTTTRDVDVRGKPTSEQQIVVDVSSADPELVSIQQVSHDRTTSVTGRSDTEVRYPVDGASSRVALAVSN